jgi:capsular exopolysaccharide synthesis family protein
MSPMSRVMQRIRESASANEPVEPPVDLNGEMPMDSAVVDETRETEGGFVAEAPAQAVRRPAVPSPVDDRTVEWDADKVDPVVIAFHDRYNAICEHYRGVRARLLTMNPQRASQVIAITSGIPEEGKSVSTLNLGLILAEGGEQRIVVADADFRRTSLARMLGVASSPGLADVLRGAVSLNDALQPTPLPNLKFLPAGDVHGQAYGDLLAGPSASATMEEFRSRFDYALIDTPPVTTVSDVCLLAPHCDGAIMVIQMCRTPEPTVQQAVRTLQANNVKVLGCLLSRARDRGTGYYEHYYSSYYYRH